VPGSDDSSRLSFRETDVLALIALGLTAAQSAYLLGTSVSTVEHDRGALRRKLGARSLAHAVAIAFEARLLPLPARRQARLSKLVGQLRMKSLRVLGAGSLASAVFARTVSPDGRELPAAEHA
jgi:DNA-binding CsgD family transcriptional regulator